MTTIAIVPDNPQGSPASFRAVAGEVQSSGATVGEALDAVRAQLGGPEQTTLVVVQPMRPDELFTAEQQQRLAELLLCWRAARDSGTSLPPQEQAELKDLVEAELRAAMHDIDTVPGGLFNAYLDAGFTAAMSASHGNHSN